MSRCFPATAELTVCWPFEGNCCECVDGCANRDTLKVRCYLADRWSKPPFCSQTSSTQFLTIARYQCYNIHIGPNITFTLVYWCLHGQAPRYLADNLIPASDAAPRRLRLRSANRNCLTVPRCRLSTYGCRAFDYTGPTVWNSLPDELRNSDSFDNFKRFMKTILFRRY